jgi:trkA domain protein
MKNILIIADSIVAKHFLERLFVVRNSTHHYTVITHSDDLKFDDLGLENFSFYKFDPTSLDRLARVANGYFTQFMVLMSDSFETLSVYKNLRIIGKNTEILMLDMWGLELEDSHLRLLDGRGVITTRLLDYLPDIPVIADNIGFGQGEIMEVRVPVGSSFMYRHINSIAQKKWRISMVYRGSSFMIAKPNLMILPNDTLLIVGDPNVLLSVFKSIKKESGQFPSPFGSNIYLFLDMQKMNQIDCMRLIDDSLKLNEKLNNKRLYIKVINATFGVVYDRLKNISNDESIRLTFDFYARNSNIIKDDVLRHDIGLVVTDNKFFNTNKKLLFEIKKPIMSIGSQGVENIKKGVVLSGGKDELENHSAVILDCCSQLDTQISLYHFDGITSDNVSEHFDSLSKIFGRKVEINSQTSINPILKLQHENNLLQFISFTKKMSSSDIFAIFSNDMNRLYSKLKDNHQIFIPIN